MFKKYENISQIDFFMPIELGIFKHVSRNRIKHDKSTNKRIYILARDKYSLLLDCSDFSIYIYLKLSACSSFSCVARETSCLKKLQTNSDRLDLQPLVEDDGDWRCVA